MKASFALVLALLGIFSAGTVQALPPPNPTTFDKDLVCSSGTYQALIGRLLLTKIEDKPAGYKGTFTDNFGVKHPAKLDGAVSPAVLTVHSSLGKFVFTINGISGIIGDWSDTTNTDAPNDFRLAPAITLLVADHSTSTRGWSISLSQWQGSPMIVDAAGTLAGTLTVSSDSEGNITGGFLALPIGPHNSNVTMPVYGGFVSAQQLTTEVKIKGRNFILSGTSASSDYNFPQAVAVYGNKKSSIYLHLSALVPTG